MHARPAPKRRRRAPKRRRAKRRVSPVVVFSIAMPLVFFGAVAFLVGFATTAFNASYDADELPPYEAPPPARIEPSIAGYGIGQLANACTILAAGRDHGFDERDQTIAIMTAMGESSLRNIDYGDWETSGVTNPDGSATTSIGLFQQQDNWGSREERLDPYTAASKFYHAMADRVPDRASIEPTLVAHDTQINSDPFHYAPYWQRAVRVVAGLNGTPVEGDITDGIPLCPAG